MAARCCRCRPPTRCSPDPAVNDTPPASPPASAGQVLDAEGADTWAHLRRYTRARIALGRAGGSARSATLLDFRLSHARARDAVLMEFHAPELAETLARDGGETVSLTTAATDRQTYLLRPDLGRTLSDAARNQLARRRAGWGARDLAIIVSDGLSALAAERQAAPVLAALRPLLQAAGWSLFPVFVVPFARVKLQDELGERLGARHTLMLLGERPGLGSPDSLGAYFTYQPRGDRTDADRNCLSNIRPEGLPPAAAARKLAQLLAESRRLGLSGVGLKDTGDALPAPATVLAPT